MKNGPFSSLTRKERFWGYMGILIIIAAILIFAFVVAVIIQQRAQLSDKISKQHSSHAPAAWNGGNDSITNALTPAPEPVIPNTNSN
jgi:hypothetical protein